MQAASKYDYRRGVKVSTYATWWVRQSVRRALDRTTRSLRLCEMDLLRSDIRLVSNLHSSQHDPNLPQYIGINLKGHTNQTPADSRYVVAQNKTQKEAGRLLVKF